MTSSDETFRFIASLVRRRAAIVIEPGKEYLVESRLAPIARAHGLASIDALAEVLRTEGDGALTSEVVEAMTTNETSFFRDVHPFEALRGEVLPEVVAARGTTRALRIWCAAASTGQEPYSIAMVLREHFPELASGTVQITATEINRAVLNRARAGVYRHLNLLDRWPLFAPPDIVFIRNVLIYFDLPTKRKILERVRKTMRGDGYLFLGGAETTMNVDDGYAPVRAGATTVIFRPRTAPPTEVRRAAG